MRWMENIYIGQNNQAMAEKSFSLLNFAVISQKRIRGFFSRKVSGRDIKIYGSIYWGLFEAIIIWNKICSKDIYLADSILTKRQRTSYVKGRWLLFSGTRLNKNSDFIALPWFQARLKIMPQSSWQ